MSLSALLTWTKGIVTTRGPGLALSAAGIVAATALIGTIGAFGISSGRTMTQRALTAVPVDWQVALSAGADLEALKAELSEVAAIRAARTVGYADAQAFTAVTGDTTQTTGAGQVLGLPPDYAATFPGQMRVLQGSGDGILVAQQTASNLHVTVGDLVTVDAGPALRFQVRIDGVVDLPNADAMFQTIGLAKGPAPTAPPDNVLILPAAVWNVHFAAAAAAPGGAAQLQIHVALDRSRLPPDPVAAFVDAGGKARNFEVRAAGAAAVGDTLLARLGAVRADALFARVLLLFLGLPGIVLALLLTVSIVGADAGRRQREQALLGLRGAGRFQIAALSAAEAGMIAGIGSLAGMVLASAIAGWLLRIDLRIPAVQHWLAGAGLAGFFMAIGTVLLPGLVAANRRTVADRRGWVAAQPPPLWHRTYADLAMLLVSGIIFRHAASTGYQLVLAPEGVAAIAIDYTAFLAPLLLWTGGGLLVLRLADIALRSGRATLTMLLGPLAGPLAPSVAAALSRQSRRIAAGTALVALAVAFATTTAIFNRTYTAQSLVDAQLTTGADVAVTGSAVVPAGGMLDLIRAVPGAAAAEPMQHRFAYVGSDLQDLYGIDASAIGRATSLADAYFGSGDAAATLAMLAQTPDGLLVSQETVDDFQLAVGDIINVRLLMAGDHRYRPVPFHLIGVANEFPTAPHDSFLVANAAYIAAQTGDAGAEVVLVRTTANPPAVASAIRMALANNPALRTTDVTQAAHLIGSSLTAIDLHTLGALELAFALGFVGMATGLTLRLGQSERARTNAILLSLGARPNGIRSFLWAEGAVLLGIGCPFGAGIGVTSAWMLVRLLGGIFDPPPDMIAVPWFYLALVLAGAIIATIAGILGQDVVSRTCAAKEIRAGR